jgi:hypothetical protein
MMAALLAAGSPPRSVVETLLQYPFESLMDGTNVSLSWTAQTPPDI